MSVAIKNVPADVSQWLAAASQVDIDSAVTMGAKLFISGAVGQAATASDKSAVRGQVGEQYVHEVLSRKYAVRNNAKTARAGDLQLYIDDVKVLVEVKNYSRVVPSAELEKFTRDMSSGLYYGGVFISLNTEIVGQRRGLYYEQCGDTLLPTVYISSDNDEIILMAAQTVISAVAAQRHSVRELYNRDFIAGEIRVMTEHLDTLSRAQSALLDSIDSAGNVLRRGASGIAAAESNMRRTVANIRTEMFDQKLIKCGQIAEHLRTKGYAVSDELSSILLDICNEVDVASWRTYKFKVTHLPTGITIGFTKSRVDITFPSKMVDSAHVMWFYSRYPGKILLDGGDLNIAIDSETSRDIREQFTMKIAK